MLVPIEHRLVVGATAVFIPLAVPQAPFIGVTHACVLHAWLSLFDPTQSNPPFAGAGLVQVLVCVCVPPPHVAEHVDHELQVVQTPSIFLFAEQFAVVPLFNPLQLQVKLVVFVVTLVAVPAPHKLVVGAE